MDSIQQTKELIHGSKEHFDTTGQFAIETTARANQVQNGRSYGLGLSLQQACSRVTINAGDRYTDGDDDMLRRRRAITRVRLVYKKERDRLTFTI